MSGKTPASYSGLEERKRQGDAGEKEEEISRLTVVELWISSFLSPGKIPSRSDVPIGHDFYPL